MKTLISILTLFAFTLYANETPSNENLDSNPSSQTSIYTAPNPPLSTEKKESSNTWKVTAAVVGTLAAVTAGLLISGKNTGNHYQQSSDTNN